MGHTKTQSGSRATQLAERGDRTSLLDPRISHCHILATYKTVQQKRCDNHSKIKNARDDHGQKGCALRNAAPDAQLKLNI